MPKRPREEDEGSSFNPAELGLDADFVLTDYTRLKGCSCKLPQPKLLQLLREVSTVPGQQDVGMDCSIVELSHKNEQHQSLFLVSTTDFFFPSVEDPYLQGQIGAANVLSDLYSMGIAECDTVLMLLAASTDMSETERVVTTREMMKGFAERVALAGAKVTGGQTVMNPWPLIGGIAMRVVAENEMVCPAGQVQVGDVLVLTKPLGNQIAVNLKQWTRRPSPLYDETIKGNVTDAEIEELYRAACNSMKRLNRTGAALMLQHKAHGATDVTGFGILGHASNFSSAQDTETTALCFVLDRLPIFKTAVKASRLMHDKYRLFEGYSAETSGGLLVALASEADAKRYIASIEKEDGAPAWIVGHVEQRGQDGKPAVLAPSYEILEV